MESAIAKEFLYNTYKFSTISRILQMDHTPPLWRIKLQNTVFHPQGGGQPNDIGSIQQGEKKFNISSAEIDREDDNVIHIGEFVGEQIFDSEQPVEVKIDEKSRRLFARIHSAGHLIDVAVDRLGLPLVPGKGYHFPSGAYVEYIGNLPLDRRESAIEEMNQILTELVSQTEEPVQMNIYEYEEAKEHMEVPKYLPVGKPIRYIRLINEDKGCPCGGTHVSHVREISGVQVTKAQKKGKNLRISYVVSQNE